MNVFVKVVFDISNNLLYLNNSNNIPLYCTIGHNKGKFFTRRKRTTKNTIMNILDGMGSIKSSSYIIIQQRKASIVYTRSVAKCLWSVEEVMGTIIYEEKKEENMA